MIKIITIGERKICIGGVGEMFYKEGFPIDLSYDLLKEKGVELSVLHLADELQKNGWDGNRIVNTLSRIFEKDKKELLNIFFNGISLRDAKFKYLFGSEEVAKDWFRENICP